jgi:hypothetical protein
MPPTNETDFPPGHPARFDYDPKSPEAVEWARKNVHPLGERDFPVDHPKAGDTPGNGNSVEWRAGVDPAHPEREEFTGRSPEQAAAVKALNAELAKAAQESPVLEPMIAPPPPKA